MHFPIDDLTLDRELWPLTSPDRAREGRLDQDQPIRRQDWATLTDQRPIQELCQVCEWRWWGWLSLSIKVKSGLWPEYWDCATQPGWVWSQLQDTNSLSVSRQLFQTGWRRRDSSLGEVARQINSKYKYLVLIVKQQCIARIQYIHIERVCLFQNTFVLNFSILVEKSNAFPEAISITKFSKPLIALNVTFESNQDIIKTKLFPLL